MFNKKYKEEILRLKVLYADKCNELEEQEKKVDIMKKDNADLAFAIRATKLHVEALSVICSALMDVITDDQRKKVEKIIKKQDNPKKLKVKVKQPKKGKKNGKKAKSIGL